MTHIKPGTASKLGLHLPKRRVEDFDATIGLWLDVSKARFGLAVSAAVEAELAASRDLEALRVAHELDFAVRVERAAAVFCSVWARTSRMTSAVEVC